MFSLEKLTDSFNFGSKGAFPGFIFIQFKLNLCPLDNMAFICDVLEEKKDILSFFSGYEAKSF